MKKWHGVVHARTERRVFPDFFVFEKDSNENATPKIETRLQLIWGVINTVMKFQIKNRRWFNASQRGKTHREISRNTAVGRGWKSLLSDSGSELLVRLEREKENWRLRR